MALADLSLNQIQLFLRAAEFRSFTATAAFFHTTQSAVSKSIAGMESALGFPLFHRGRGQLTLTEPGQCLYERWQGLMGSLTAAVQEAERRWQDRRWWSGWAFPGRPAPRRRISPSCTAPTPWRAGKRCGWRTCGTRSC